MLSQELYEKDFYAWAMTMSEALKSKNLSLLDFEHLAEEIEDMGRSEKRALESRLEILIMHLLKYKYQPCARTYSWQGTIKVQRNGINKLILNMPSLKRYTDEMISDVYEDALINAAIETGLAETTFPKDCPFTLEQILDTNYLPN